MNCPVCRVGMIIVEYQDVEVDYCVECRGIWFDRDELEFYLSATKVRIEDLHIEPATGETCAALDEKPRRCPRCNKTMSKLCIWDGPPVIVDRCERHGGYWFDGGELRSVIKRGAPREEWKNVMQFLGSLFPSDDNEKET